MNLGLTTLHLYNTFDHNVAIYKLACLWEIHTAKSQAQAALNVEQHKAQNAIKMFHFAHEYHINDWLASAFRKLIGQEFCSFSKQEIQAIGSEDVISIGRT